MWSFRNDFSSFWMMLLRLFYFFVFLFLHTWMPLNLWEKTCQKMLFILLNCTYLKMFIISRVIDFKSHFAWSFWDTFLFRLQHDYNASYFMSEDLPENLIHSTFWHCSIFSIFWGVGAKENFRPRKKHVSPTCVGGIFWPCKLCGFLQVLNRSSLIF